MEFKILIEAYSVDNIHSAISEWEKGCIFGND